RYRLCGLELFDLCLGKIFGFLVIIAKSGVMFQLGFEDIADTLSSHIAGRNIIVTAKTLDRTHKIIDVFCTVEIYAVRDILRHREIIRSGEMKDVGRLKL